MVTETASTARRQPMVLDKYMLPRVAFFLVSTASLAGAILTGLRHGWVDWPALAARWAALWSLGLFLGAEVWKIFYLRPSVRVRPVEGAQEYGVAMLEVHNRLQKRLLPLLIAAVGVYIYLYTAATTGNGLWLLLATGAMAVAVIGITRSWRHTPTRDNVAKQEFGSWLTMGGLAVAVACMGALDVIMQKASYHSWLLVPNRMLHVWAFAAWLGGAFWNIFIAVPAGIERTDMDTVILANFQLERFRVVVRTVFPTIIITGLVQTWAIFGWQWQALFTNTWGKLIVFKIGLILSLVVVFITCPMWRACSPIRGVCNLDDLDD